MYCLRYTALMNVNSNRTVKCKCKILQNKSSFGFSQVVEENVGLKSEIEALEAEIAEVQDTFRYIRHKMIVE